MRLSLILDRHRLVDDGLCRLPFRRPLEAASQSGSDTAACLPRKRSCKIVVSDVVRPIVGRALAAAVDKRNQPPALARRFCEACLRMRLIPLV